MDKNGKLLEDWDQEVLNKFEDMPLNELRKRKNLCIESCNSAINRLVDITIFDKIPLINRLVDSRECTIDVLNDFIDEKKHFEILDKMLNNIKNGKRKATEKMVKNFNESENLDKDINVFLKWMDNLPTKDIILLEEMSKTEPLKL